MITEKLKRGVANKSYLYAYSGTLIWPTSWHYFCILNFFRRTFRVSNKKQKGTSPAPGIRCLISVSKKGYKRQDKTHHTHSSDLRLDCCPVPPKTYIFNLLFICTKFLYGVWCRHCGTWYQLQVPGGYPGTIWKKLEKTAIKFIQCIGLSSPWTSSSSTHTATPLGLIKY